MDNKPEECDICLTTYDEEERRPRTLPCGHTFCSQCVAGLLEEGQLTCPTCRTQHPAPDISQFPISYSMEAFIRKLSGSQQPLATSTPQVPQAAGLTAEAATVARRRQHKHASGMSKILRSLVQEQSSSVEGLAETTQKELLQLDGYQAQLGACKAEHLQLLDRLHGLVNQHKAALGHLQEEEDQVGTFRKEGEAQHQGLKATLEGLACALTAQEAVSAIQDADHSSIEAEDWLQRSQEQFPNGNTLVTSSTVLKVTKAMLESVEHAESRDPTDSALSGHLEGSLMNKVKVVLLGKLNLENLLNMKEPVKSWLKAGQLFVVQREEDGCCRSSKLTMENGQLYVHSLLDQPLPPSANTLQMSEIMESLDPSSTLVFMDLASPDSTKQRVHIRVTSDTPLGRQFVLLCTGQLGPTYANTRLLLVGSKGGSGQYVLGGDYQNNDGKGGASLLPNLHGDYTNSDVAGTVGSWYGPNTVDKSAQFYIATGGGSYCWPYGKVEKGLQVLQEAARRSNIRDVNVVDCGVVLSTH